MKTKPLTILGALVERDSDLIGELSMFAISSVDGLLQEAFVFEDESIMALKEYLVETEPLRYCNDPILYCSKLTDIQNVLYENNNWLGESVG